MVSLAWFAHTWKLAERFKVAMGVHRNFFQGGKRRHFGYHFQVADVAMQMDVYKTHSCFYTTKKIPHESTYSIRSYFETFFKWSCRLDKFVTKVHFPSSVATLLNWRVNVVIIVNSTQMSLQWPWTSSYVFGSPNEQKSLLKPFVRIVFYTSAVRNAFPFHKLPNLHFCQHFLQISHNLRTINAQINISGEKPRS